MDQAFLHHDCQVQHKLDILYFTIYTTLFCVLIKKQVKYNLFLNYTQPFYHLFQNYDIFSNKIIGAISLNYNGEESILKYYEQVEINDYFVKSGFKSVNYSEIGQSSKLSTVDINKPFSYWKICIILTLIFVGIEMLLVRFLK